MCILFILLYDLLNCYIYLYCLYADDVILLSASVLQLQQMLDICSTQAADIDIAFNAKKSSLFAVGKLFDWGIESTACAFV